MGCGMGGHGMWQNKTNMSKRSKSKSLSPWGQTYVPTEINMEIFLYVGDVQTVFCSLTLVCSEFYDIIVSSIFLRTYGILVCDWMIYDAYVNNYHMNDFGLPHNEYSPSRFPFEYFYLFCISKFTGTGKSVDDIESLEYYIADVGWFLEFADRRFRENVDIVTKAVTCLGWTLKYASRAIRGIKRIVELAINREPHSLRFASKDLKNDKDLVMTAVNMVGCALSYASDNLKGDVEVVLAAVKTDGRAYLSVIGEARASIEVCFAAVANNRMMYKEVGLEAHNNFDLAMLAVEHGAMLQYASSTLQNDKQVVMKAIGCPFGHATVALKYASPKLQVDKDVIIKALDASEFVLSNANIANNTESEIREITGVLIELNDMVLNDN